MFSTDYHPDTALMIGMRFPDFEPTSLYTLEYCKKLSALRFYKLQNRACPGSPGSHGSHGSHVQ